MENDTLWHNPRCSKSRGLNEFLTNGNVEYDIVEYLKNPPTVDQIEKALKLLGMSDPRELMRKKEKPYLELNLADEKKSKKELIQAMIENPILIERPIFFYQGKAAIGRPLENVTAILNS
jgi:arsenate reductase